jgi:deoxyribose-phosphate aldolase
VIDDVKGVVRAAGGRTVKTIIETWVLDREQIERACRAVEEAGAHTVKTTTGVRTQYLDMVRKGARGAEIDDIKLMRRILSPHMHIKASGGIYMLDDALSFIRAGADQLGMSRGEEVVGAFRDRFGEETELT